MSALEILSMKDHLDLLGVTIDFSEHIAKKESWKVVRCFEQLNERVINFLENVPLQLVRNVLLHLLFCYLAQL